MINVQQLYNLGLAVDINIFDDITVPAECKKLNAEIIKSACFERCGLNIPIYPDPDTFKAAVKLWSAKNQYTFIHIDKIMQSEYSPIENVFEDKTTSRKFDGTTDRKEDGENHSTGSDTRDLKENLKNDSTQFTHGKVTTESGIDQNNTENTISAYDSNTYQPDNKSENKITYGHTSTDSGTDSTNRNYDKFNTGTTSNKKDVNSSLTGKETKDDKETITESRHGNIGITSANKLQIEEYNMLAEFNPYTFISELFEKELTLYIY